MDTLVTQLVERRTGMLIDAAKLAGAIMALDPEMRFDQPLYIPTLPATLPDVEIIVGTLDVKSDNGEAVYYITIYRDDTARCTCASYVRGNKECKHIRREGYTRHDGMTTPARKDLPYTVLPKE